MKLAAASLVVAAAKFVAAAPNPAVVDVASTATAATASGTAGSAAAGQASDGLFHLLSHDLQHALAGVIEHHMDEHGKGALQDPEVDALLSGLLHDELEDRSKAAEATAAAEAAQWAEEQRQAEQQAKARAAERMRQQAAREAAHDAERAAQAQRRRQEQEQHDAQLKKAKEEADVRAQEHEALMEKHRQHLEEHKKHHAALQEQHAKNWDRISSILQQVHTGLEDLTHGWRDVPFWDDFFKNTSTASGWKNLALEHLQPALEASPVLPSHSVLFLEPSKTGLADRLAAALQTGHGLASAFGAEGEASHDTVVEVGLLDAMAMGGNGTEGPRVDALRHAVARLSSLVKPGGTWLSVSVVPPTLRAPLLGRLVGATFAAPSGGAEEVPGTGTHSITLASASDGAAAPPSAAARAALRGSAQVANLLLYGSSEAHVWAYRLRRAEEPPAPAGGDHAEDGGLFSMIRQQRPGTRDDL